MGASLATRGSPLTGPLVLAAASAAADRRARFDTLPGTLAAPVLPGAASLAQAFAAAGPVAAATAPLPRAAVQAG